MAIRPAKHIYIFLFACAPAIFISSSLKCQTGSSLHVPSVSDSLIEMYLAHVPAEMRFLNGRISTYRYPGARGHAFFGDGSWKPGTIVTFSGTYKSDNLRYDLLRNKLLMLVVSGNEPRVIEMNPAEILGFSIGNLAFEDLRKTRTELTGAAPGFYQVIATGKASVYARYMKTLSAPSTNTPGEYLLQKELYISRNNTLNKIINRKSIRNILADKELQMKNYIRQHHISLRQSTDASLAEMTRFYNSLP